jgi:hypothetical protein
VRRNTKEETVMSRRQRLGGGWGRKRKKEIKNVAGLVIDTYIMTTCPSGTRYSRLLFSAFGSTKSPV